MDQGLTISFIIGGLLMIMVVTLNVRMGQHSSELTLHGMSVTSRQDIANVIESDFSKIGYNLTGPIGSAISVAAEKEIEFKSNLKNDASGTVNTVSWKLTDDSPAGTENPNTRTLVRLVDADQTEINLGVTKFTLEYFDKDNNLIPFPVADKNAIRRIKVVLETQSREKINYNNGNGYFPASRWEKVITPPNLKL